jgi:hypothetical protein
MAEMMESDDNVTMVTCLVRTYLYVTPAVMRIWRHNIERGVIVVVFPWFIEVIMSNYATHGKRDILLCFCEFIIDNLWWCELLWYTFSKQLFNNAVDILSSSTFRHPESMPCGLPNWP